MRWLLELLLGWFRRKEEDQLAARAREVVEREQFQAVRDRLLANDKAAADPDPETRLKADWPRHGAAALLVAGLGLTACAQGSVSVPHAVDTGCTWARPILIAQDDHLTTATARDILAHNETWKLRCTTKRQEQ